MVYFMNPLLAISARRGNVDRAPINSKCCVRVSKTLANPHKTWIPDIPQISIHATIEYNPTLIVFRASSKIVASKEATLEKWKKCC